MNGNPSPQRRGTSLAVFIMLVVAGLGFLLVPFTEGGIDLPDFDLGDGAVLRVLAYFLLVDGLLSFFGGLVYITTRVPRVLESPQAEALREELRANLSMRSTEQAERALQDLPRRVWRRGLIFVVAGLVSLAVAAALLTGVLA
jgi:hypothetical protein